MKKILVLSSALLLVACCGGDYWTQETKYGDYGEYSSAEKANSVTKSRWVCIGGALYNSDNSNKTVLMRDENDEVIKCKTVKRTRKKSEDTTSTQRDYGEVVD